MARRGVAHAWARIGEGVEGLGVNLSYALGDEVVLLGDGITAEELAEKTSTISYEVFCRISARVPRVYR